MSYEAHRETTYFASLDGIRAAAVLAVLASHIPSSDVFSKLAGGRGVTWFFALSGFLITTLALREEERRGRMDLGGFVTRRAFRILPLYVVALLTWLALDLTVLRDTSYDVDGWWSYWPYYLTMMQDVPFQLGWPDVPFGVAWSLGVEEKFYVVWPVVGFVLMTPRTRVWLTMAGSAALGASLVVWSGTDWFNLTKSYLPIILGCVGAMLVHDRRTFRVTSWLSHPVLLALLVVAVVVRPPDAIWDHRLYPLAYAGVVAGAVVGFALRPRAPGLSAPAVLWIGRRSYAIYLFHLCAIRLLEEWLDGTALDGERAAVVIFVLAVVATFAVAEVLHRTVEVPCIALGRRLAGRRVAGASPTVGLPNP